MSDSAPIPRFRAKSYKMRDGTIHTYYVWDGRGRGLREIRLGKDRDRALELWAQCEKGVIPGGSKRKRAPVVLKVAQPKKRRVVGDLAWLSSERWVRTMFFNAERRATKMGRPFTITPADMLNLVAEANGVCQLSGIPFDKTQTSSPFAPSLDRIECAKGYEPGNVRLVCHVANVAMNTWGIEPVLRLARAIIAPTTDAGCA